VLEELLPHVLGPEGALVLAVAAVTALWRQSRRDLAEMLSTKNADIAYERARSERAEARLESLGGLLKDATSLMDRSLTVTDKTLDRLRERDER